MDPVLPVEGIRLAILDKASAIFDLNCENCESVIYKLGPDVTSNEVSGSMDRCSNKELI